MERGERSIVVEMRKGDVFQSDFSSSETGSLFGQLDIHFFVLFIDFKNGIGDRLARRYLVSDCQDRHLRKSVGNLGFHRAVRLARLLPDPVSGFVRCLVVRMTDCSL